ncbi:MAG: glycosyltransferase family protein [Lachnospiraceae bacterium]|nr:glycosyltransferase family protein [Lachnospiraceae bacterium]
METVKLHEIHGEGIEETEICFIICTNNPVYAEECIYYIRHLTVPEGVRINILTVEDAKSLTSGYNEALKYSQAKYKVYLHHDTFIINSDFIQDCLEIFESDPRIGMIGNVGVKTMPASGVMWDADRYGMLYEQHIYETQLLANAISPELAYLEVDAIDGFLMVTQYDVPWREDLFDKWDFYDCSQSMEFIKKGYKVVVPNMKNPWCVHDCGFINLEQYDIEREKFIAEYLTDKKG